MTISLHNVTPAPLAGVIALNTDIWQKECVFQSGVAHRVVAPSGKGKSTLMHCIYGLRHDYSGDVKINGLEARALSSNEWADLRQEHLSIVFQDLRLFLNLTARQNIQVKAALYQQNNEDQVMAMAERLRVTHILDKTCNTLSYGERQRVAIIRALIQPFDFLLLDEPFSHLDQENTINAVALIVEAVAARKAGMIVTALGEDHFFKYDKELQL